MNYLIPISQSVYYFISHYSPLPLIMIQFHVPCYQLHHLRSTNSQRSINSHLSQYIYIHIYISIIRCYIMNICLLHKTHWRCLYMSLKDITTYGFVDVPPKFENFVLYILELECIKHLDLNPSAHLSSHICTLNLILSIKYNPEKKNAVLATPEMVCYLRLISSLTD